MKSVEEMTRKEFLSLPVYKDWQSYLFVDALYMIQTKRKHDSGYACFVSAAEIDGKMYILGKCHDMLEIEGCHIDCFLKNGVLRFFPYSSRVNKIKIGHRLSSFYAEAVEVKEKDNA